jgi:hypothetical protein
MRRHAEWEAWAERAQAKPDPGGGDKKSKG